MSPWINYHHLYYFKTIAEEGSVSKAAVKLRLGQPTLSAQLKQFEGSLGVRLFERSHKKLLLTEHGVLALEYARGIFRMGSEMYEALHDRLKPLKPLVHLGALDSVPKQVVLRLVQQALQISSAQVTLSEGRPNELLRELAAHRMDLMLTNFLPTGVDAKGLYPRRVSRQQVGFYGAKSFRALRKNFPRSVSGVPMILPTYDSKLRQDLDHWAKLHEIDLNLVVESQDISVKKLMASHGIGLIPAASHSVSVLVKQGDLFEIGAVEGVYEELYLLSAQRKIENPIASKLKVQFTLS